MSEDNEKKSPPVVPKRPQIPKRPVNRPKRSVDETSEKELVLEESKPVENGLESPGIGSNEGKLDSDEFKLISDESKSNSGELESNSDEIKPNFDEIESNFDDDDRKAPESNILKKQPPIIPRRITSSSLNSIDSNDDILYDDDSKLEKTVSRTDSVEKTVSRTNSVGSSAKPVVPRRPSRVSSEDVNAQNVKPPVVKKKPPPIAPKKPSSKILAFQNMLNQQQQQNQARFAPVSRRGSELSTDSAETSEDPQNGRKQFAKNLDGIFGVALPGMGAPPGFLPGKLSRPASHSDQEPEEPKLVENRRARVKGARGRRLPTSAAKKVEIKTEENVGFTIHVEDVWELNTTSKSVLEDPDVMVDHAILTENISEDVPAKKSGIDIEEGVDEPASTPTVEDIESRKTTLSKLEAAEEELQHQQDKEQSLAGLSRTSSKTDEFNFEN